MHHDQNPSIDDGVIACNCPNQPTDQPTNVPLLRSTTSQPISRTVGCPCVPPNRQITNTRDHNERQQQDRYQRKQQDN